MKLLIDDGNIEAIESVFKLGIFSGITTNPSIIKSSNIVPMDLLKIMLKKFTGKLFVQCVSTELQKIKEEGEKLYSLSPQRIVLKIPFSENGIMAAKYFVEKGIPVTITAIHNLSQVVISSLAEVDFVAPYVNRMENAGLDISVVRVMQTYLENSNSKTQLIAASFKNIKQFEKIVSYNVPYVTASVNIYKEIFNNGLTQKAIKSFDEDWRSIAVTEWVK